MRLHLNLPATQHRAPATDIAIVRFKKIDRTLEIGGTWSGLDLGLPRIDLHERARQQQRVKAVVLPAHVSVGEFARLQFFFSSRRRHTRCLSDWSSDVCSSD